MTYSLKLTSKVVPFMASKIQDPCLLIDITATMVVVRGPKYSSGRLSELTASIEWQRIFMLLTFIRRVCSLNWGAEIAQSVQWLRYGLLFANALKSALGPTQPRIKGVLGAHSPEVNRLRC